MSPGKQFTLQLTTEPTQFITRKLRQPIICNKKRKLDKEQTYLLIALKLFLLGKNNKELSRMHLDCFSTTKTDDLLEHGSHMWVLH